MSVNSLSISFPKDITRSTDDNTVCACDNNVDLEAVRLEDDVSRALDWFEDNKW